MQGVVLTGLPVQGEPGGVAESCIHGMEDVTRSPFGVQTRQNLDSTPAAVNVIGRSLELTSEGRWFTGAACGSIAQSATGEYPTSDSIFTCHVRSPGRRVGQCVLRCSLTVGTCIGL